MTRRIYYSEWAHLTQLGSSIKEQVCVPLLCRSSCPMLGTPRIVVLCGTTISSCLTLGNLCRLVVSDVWHIADNCVVQNYCSKQYTVTLCYLCRLSCPMFGIPRIIVFCVTMPIVVSDVCRTEDNCIVRIYADCRVQCLVYRV